MKVARFWDSAAGTTSWGVIEKDGVYPISRDPYEEIKRFGAGIPLSAVKFLAPCAPTKIVCGGLNYKGHAKEVNLPIPKSSPCFLKPTSALVGDGEAIVYPPETSRLEFEGELGVVIKRRMHETPPEDVPEHILGYTCGNDVTARDIQFEGGNFLNLGISKAFDTFCPVGPWVETELDPSNLDISLTVNGKIRQKSNTNDMIFPVPVMLSYFSHIMTLNPGDLILTGTPGGIGRMEVGDIVALTIEGIGTLTNPIVASKRLKPCIR